MPRVTNTRQTAKNGGALLGALGAAALLGMGAAQVRARLQPRTQGTLRLKGLREGVEVIRDKWGVPHIYAANTPDLLFAQGFVHAQDRFWQMELNRRVGAGRMSEIVGPQALDLDRLMRRIGLRQAAIANDKALTDPHQRSILDAYVAGVNAYLDSQPLPLECLFLRYRPEAWTAADSLQWSKLMGWSLSNNWEAELLRLRLVEALGPEAAAKLESLYEEGRPVIVPHGNVFARTHVARADSTEGRVLRAYGSLRELTGIGFFGNGSNSWAVDGTKTATGKPLLANDPHLRISLPGIWYQAHLVAPDYDVSGATLPGSPFVVIGHNRHCAWGITSAMADNQDLFVERVNPGNPDQYRYRGQWRNFTIRREYIGVKGQHDELEIVRSSIHGPVITALDKRDPRPDGTRDIFSYDTEGDYVLAVSWTGYEPGNDLAAIDGVNRAASWDDFHTALADWTIPPLNFTYADTDGTIGYQLTGRYPLRAESAADALLPTPGWDGRGDWRGVLNYAELPYSLNPDSHSIVTANNRIVGDDYPHHLSHEYMPPWRASRITALLQAQETFTPADFARMQADTYTIPGAALARILVERLAENPAPTSSPNKNLTPNPFPAREGGQDQDKTRLGLALAYLRNWDGFLTTDSVAATIYESSVTHLLRRVLGPAAGELLDAYLGNSAQVLSPVNAFLGRAIPMLLRHIAADDTTLLHWPGTDSAQTWDDALYAALTDALADLSRTLGPDMARWRWGRLHRLPYEHPLGAVKPLDRIFNRPSVEVPGDAETLFPGAFVHVPGGAFKTVGWTSSYRQIIDLADLDHARYAGTTGQSGWPFSRHYFDLAADWLAVRHQPMLFSRADIAAATEASLMLLPRT